jgi:uncharacterized protein (TIRG00374 family)
LNQLLKTIHTAEILPLGTTLAWAKAWRRPSTWVVVTICLGLLSWVLWRANVSDVWKSIRAADYGLIGVCLPVILFGLILRAMRWGILLLPLGKPPFWASFRSLTVGYLGNNLLPARGGELVRAYMLGRQAQINTSSILATIVMERMSDALVMFLGLSVLLVAFPRIIPVSQLRIAAAGAAVLFGIIVVLVAIQSVRDRVVSAVRFLCFWLPEWWEVKCVSLVEDFMCGLRSFCRLADALLYSLMTILVWTTDILVFWLVSQAFDLSLTVPAVILLVAIGALSTMIPALPGYVGTYQFALVHTLTFLGVLMGPATAFAFGIHGVIWLTANLIGAVCALQIGLKLSQPQNQAA